MSNAKETEIPKSDPRRCGVCGAVGCKATGGAPVKKIELFWNWGMGDVRFEVKANSVSEAKRFLNHFVADRCEEEAAAAACPMCSAVRELPLRRAKRR